jgi:hypothetical protein
VNDAYVQHYALVETAVAEPRWYEWRYRADGQFCQGDDPVAEAHIIRAGDERRHRPQNCWCLPETHRRDNGVLVLRHRT